MEVWKDIQGYEGLYQISNKGRVKNFKTNRILTVHQQPNGYSYITLHKEGKPKTFRIHRLVAQAFIPNPNNLPCINHKNEIKTDNRVENLEFCTNKYNSNYGTAKERATKKRINGKKSFEVLQFDLKGNFIKEWQSTMEVERATGFYNNNISKCCRGGYKQAYGYIWKYKKGAA